VTWIGIGLALGWLVSGLLGVILFGTDGDWQMVVLAWLTSWLCDAAVAALALCVATFVRTVVMSLLGCLFFLLADWFVGIGLSIANWAAEMAEVPALLEATIQLRPWLPSSAFGAWTSFSGGDPWLWQHFAALVAITVLSLVVGAMRFERTDVH
jgi:ABC-type transport system involved in multi-copper enzyme maturation permease subunit